MAAAASRDENLDALRALMAAHSPPLHALVVPSEDAHQVRAPCRRLRRSEAEPIRSGSSGFALQFRSKVPYGLWFVTSASRCLWIACLCRANTCRSGTSGGSSYPGSPAALVRVKSILSLLGNLCGFYSCDAILFLLRSNTAGFTIWGCCLINCLGRLRPEATSCAMLEINHPLLNGS